MTTRKLNGHSSAAATIIFDADCVYLKSYSTIVLKVDGDGWLTVTGLYSRTTIKHIGWFMREMFGLTYYHAKEVYTSGIQFNVYTGEVKGE